MRISDWSSDVCSSDLHCAGRDGSERRRHPPPGQRRAAVTGLRFFRPVPELREARRGLRRRRQGAARRARRDRHPEPANGGRGMSSFARTDTSLMGRWWWTVDRWTLLALVALMGFGALLMLAASPAAAERIGLQSFQLARRRSEEHTSELQTL